MSVPDKNQKPPRYLRSVTALVLGAGAATAMTAAAGAVVAGCTGDDDSGDDQPPIVDSHVDASVVVDGPLPPPDLPVVA